MYSSAIHICIGHPPPFSPSRLEWKRNVNACRVVDGHGKSVSEASCERASGEAWTNPVAIVKSPAMLAGGDARFFPLAAAKRT